MKKLILILLVINFYRNSNADDKLSFSPLSATCLKRADSLSKIVMTEEYGKINSFSVKANSEAYYLELGLSSEKAKKELIDHSPYSIYFKNKKGFECVYRIVLVGKSCALDQISYDNCAK